jgi:outer membrane protein assembly factor BamB
MKIAAKPIAALLLAAWSALSCAAPDGEPSSSGNGAADSAPVDLTTFDTASWVSIYDPARAWNGLTLGLYSHRIPMLFDMNGRLVHSWPEARVKSRVRLLEDCSLLGIGLGSRVVEYDWNGNLIWEFARAGMLPHHDVIRLENGNNMLIVSAEDRRTDNLLEVNREGEVVWEWRSVEHLAFYDPTLPKRGGDLTHINSVQELPPNRLAGAGDERFRRGNLLISARNMNAVFVIDRKTKKVVWTYDTELDLQHEALMIARGSTGSGRIQIFNNGYRRWYEYRKSVIVEIDPEDDSITWSYRSDDFYSPTGGVEQPLPNGNVLIGSTRGGRAFEVTRKGEIVWEWAPPFNPTRPSRYAYDHCPRLAELGPPAEEPVRAPRGYRFVDQPVYRYAPGGALRKIVVDGSPRVFLKENNQCRRLFLPAAATVTATYGLHRRKLERQGREDLAARFALRISPEGSSEEIALEEVLDQQTGVWRGRVLRLGPWAHRWVEACVETEAIGAPGATEDFAYWEAPVFRSEEIPAAPEPDEAASPGDLTPEELEVQRQHLETLGYVN